MSTNIYSVAQQLKRYPSNKRLFVTNHVANANLTFGLTGSVHTNLGATEAVTLDLPSNADKGVNFVFIVAAAQDLVIAPPVDHQLIVNGAVQDAGKTIKADDEGERAEVIYLGDKKWVVTVIGTWTVES